MPLINAVQHIISKFPADLISGDNPFAIFEVEDALVVNMDVVCNRIYQILGVNELLYEIARRGRDRKLIFLFQDGANIELSGAMGIIQKSIGQLSLTANNCIILYPGPINVPGATVINVESYRIWEKQINLEIKDLPLARPIFTRHFAGMYARFNLYRLKLFRHLYTNYRDQSILSFNTSKINYSTRFAKEFADDFDWANTHLPVTLDIKNANGFIGYQSALANLAKIYEDYFIEIVSETDTHNKMFYTEKTMKNFWLGKPFLLYAESGSLEYLRKLGYKTFSPYINETYDTIQNDYLRLEAIKIEIDRLAKLSIEELVTIHLQLESVFEHNRNLGKQHILAYEPASRWLY